MRCVSCDEELIAGKKFCPGCGAPVAIRCRSCGATLEPAFRFCPDCGAATSEPTGNPDRPPRAPRNDLAKEGDGPLHIPAPLAEKIRATQGVIRGERKLVTVLFCDLVGSTAIAAALDPEVYRDLLDQYLELAFREIYRFEGIVNQLAGDGMMALFGAPIAHEDAPHRAVRAAIAIRRALARFNAESGRAFPLELRIGINTGPVVVGTVGNDFKMDYTAIGDTTNLASRLQSLAAPGMILISEGTRRLTRGFFETKAVGPLEVKGKSERVTAYEVADDAGDSNPMTAAEARGLTPFVGRANELAQLEACYERLLGNLPQVVTIVGDAGSGKSRLLYEHKRLHAADDLVIFEARCSALTQNVPYAPIIGMLRQYFGIALDDARDCSCDKLAEKLARVDPKLDRIYPFFCRLLSLSTKDSVDFSEDDVRRATVEAISHLIVATSLETPVLISFEDLHWIDESSRELIEDAVAELRSTRVMLVFTHRPEHRPAWRPQAAFTQLSLQPLAAEHARGMVRAILGGELPDTLERRILAKAEGNPFFVEEISRALLEEGDVVRTEGRIELRRAAADIRIPGTVQELIAARLDRLGIGPKRVAQVASVFGRQFRAPHLERLLEGEGLSVAVELAELERRGIIHRKDLLSGDEFRFGESLTQEVAYESLLLKERRMLHERVARLFESELADGERTALVAHHFARSDDRKKALESLLAAGRHAEGLPSFPAAIGFYRRSWELAEAWLAEGGLSAEPRALVVAAAEAFCRMTVFYGAPHAEAAERAARLGRELAEAAGNTSAVASFYAYEGMVLGGMPRARGGDNLALLEKGLAIAQDAGLEMVALRVSRGLSWAYFMDGRFEVARNVVAAIVGKLDALGERASLTDFYFGSRFILNLMFFHSDELELARKNLEDTYELALRKPNRTAQSGSSAQLAWIELLRGNFAEAKRLADRSLEVADTIGNPSILRNAAAIALTARLELGERTPIAPYLERIDQTYSSTADAGIKVLLVTEVLLRTGEVERARQFAEAAWEHARGRFREALAALSLARVARAGGPERFDEAEEWLSRASSAAAEIGSRSTLALATLEQGEISLERGDTEQGERQLREAFDALEALGMKRDRDRARRPIAAGRIPAAPSPLDS